MNTKYLWIMISLILLGALLAGCGGGGTPVPSATPAPTAPPAATPTPSADDHVAQGIAHIEAGKLDEAIDELEAAIALNPNHAGAYVQLGNAHYNLGQFEAAVAALQAAAKLDAGNADIHRNLGTAYGKMSQWEEAAAAYQKAIELKPDFGEAYGDLASAYVGLNKLPEAVAAGKKAVELAPKYVTGYNNLGIAYGMQGDLEAAIALFKEGLQIDAQDAMAHYNLGYAYEQLNQLDQAIEEYKQAIRSDSNYADARENLGSILAQQDKLDEAIAEWQALLKIMPERASTHRLLGLAYSIQGKAQEAVAEFETYLKLAPDAQDKADIEQEIDKLTGKPSEQEGVYRNAAGGYSFPAPPGWYREESGAMVKFSESPSAMQNAPDAAPLILFQAGPLNELADKLSLASDADADAYLQAMVGEAELTVGDAQSGNISGYPAALATLSSQSPALQGAIVVVLIEGRGVSGIAMSPPEQWEACSSIFTAMIKGLAFAPPEYRSTSGGYSVRYPGSWSYEEAKTTVTFALTKQALEQPEGDALKEGPLVVFSASSLPEITQKLAVADASDPAAFAKAMAATFDAQVGGIETGQIGGYPAAYANISGVYKGASYQGGLVAVLTPDRLIGAYVMAPPKLWSDVRPIFSDMLESAAFFEP